MSAIERKRRGLFKRSDDKRQNNRHHLDINIIANIFAMACRPGIVAGFPAYKVAFSTSAEIACLSTSGIIFSRCNIRRRELATALARKHKRQAKSYNNQRANKRRNLAWKQR